MQSIVISLVLKWVVSQIAAAGAAANWTNIKAQVDAQITALAATLHAGFAAPMLQSYANDVMDAVAKLAQDNTDLSTLLGSLAAKNVTAAEAALQAMLLTVTTGDLQKLIAAV